MTLNPIIQYPVFNIKKIPTFSQNMSCFLEQNDDFSALCDLLNQSGWLPNGYKSIIFFGERILS